ncbi:MAG: hypothetical protein HYW78_02335 [Parcubacteria group bacterium]|nr:hypothetical protein [Parcubacteria group bacterium]
MSVKIKTVDGQQLDKSGFIGPNTETVFIGEYEIPIEEFCDFAQYILSGGLFGWGGDIPDCVLQTLVIASESIQEQLNDPEKENKRANSELVKKFLIQNKKLFDSLKQQLRETENDEISMSDEFLKKIEVPDEEKN